MAGNPTAVAQKWVRNMQGSTESIREGVQNVTVAPGQKAADAADLWLMRTQASKEKFRRNVAAVPLEEWKRKMLGVGLQRVAEGAAANEGKMASFLQEFLPYVEQGAQTVRAMPKGTLESGIARMVAQVRHNAGFRRTR